MTQTVLARPYVMEFEEPLYRLSVDQYHRLIETGVFNADDKIELLEGILVEKHPNYDSHHAFVMEFSEPLYRLSVERYHQMIESGVFTENDKIELLEGILVQKMPKNDPHSDVQSRINRALILLLLPNWVIRGQEPITLSTSEPEPDLVIARGEFDDYSRRKPNPADIGLLIEISDSTYRSDSGWKKGLYARAGIAVYWIVNLNARRIEVYTFSDGDEYGEPALYSDADTIPVILDGQTVGVLTVKDLLPPPQ